ncbi:rngB [Symbiodinium pilosum]|uniref:RngB protein n=1 Tax=Symbiodinium pilosum TaxID=2952 RepID=A0A812XLI6_SYMPI|nr:rngB [Symbiodinium pilosum]
MPVTDRLSDCEPVVTINRCISSIYAYRSNADAQSIRAAETKIGRAPPRSPNANDVVSVTVEDFVRMDDVDRAMAHVRSKASVAEQFLKSGWHKRVLLLTRAKHPWVTMQYVSLFRSHTVRASLIILKLVSAAAANALFFISAATTPDSDPDCAPPQNFAERMLRAGIVGILSACMGDILIVLLAMVQRRSVVIRESWTLEAKDWQLKQWLCRSYLFWILWLADVSISVLYVFGFLANVSMADAEKWMASTGMSLLQDLVLKPVYLALAYGTLASLVLCASPSIAEKVMLRWMLCEETPEKSADLEAASRPATDSLRQACTASHDAAEIYTDSI